MNEMFQLAGRTAVITGGSRGIGKAIARGFAANGANVVVVGRNQESCNATVAEFRASGHSAIPCPGHMGSLQDISKIVKLTVEEFGGIDIIVNNAATALSEPIGQMTPTALAKSFEVNLRGPVFLIQEALPYLQASTCASVINVVSASVWKNLAEVAAYSATKAGLMSFTRTTAAALAEDGIRVNALSPGIVATEMQAGAGEPFVQKLTSSNLMRRAASVDEMVGPAIFLASNASSFMTGTVLHVDGGFVTA